MASDGRTQVLWMLQPQVFPEKLHPARQMITTDSIDRYNSAARSVLSSSSSDQSGVIGLWSSMPSLCEEDLDAMPDGLHLPLRALKQGTLMLLNSHCNDNMNFHDGTCCKSSNKPTNLQIIFFCFLSCCAAVCVLRFLRHHCCVRRSAYHQATLPLSSHQQTTSRSMMLYQLLTTGSAGQPPRKPPVRAAAAGNGANAGGGSGLDVDTFFFSFAKLGLILAYFYVCDRTNYFMKENK